MNKLSQDVKLLLLNDYKERNIDRKTIVTWHKVKLKYINYFLKKNGIEIWDDHRKIPMELREIVIKEYTENKIKRDEIAIKYKIELRRINLILKEASIDKWDLKRTIVTKSEGKKKKSNNTKYYNPMRDKSNYAKMFYEFNK